MKPDPTVNCCGSPKGCGEHEHHPIAVWYHCKVAGEGIPDPDIALGIMDEQMKALKNSGLEASAEQIHIGINGQNWLEASALAPKKALLYLHGENSKTELPTFAFLRKWLPEHKNYYVLYHHSKGVTQPEDDFHHHHRHVMQGFCVENWQRCVKDLDRGYEAVGCNWVDPITRPVLPGRYFAGNFWWAKAEYLLTLPAMPDHADEYNIFTRMMAEGWIGSGPGRPLVLDYERPQLSNWCRNKIKA